LHVQVDLRGLLTLSPVREHAWLVLQPIGADARNLTPPVSLGLQLARGSHTLSPATIAEQCGG
jgi:hypothetical protein